MCVCAPEKGCYVVVDSEHAKGDRFATKHILLMFCSCAWLRTAVSSNLESEKHTLSEQDKIYL